MRALLCSLWIVALVAAPAAAETELVVLGPAVSGKVKGPALQHLKKALEATAPVAKRSLDGSCASDPLCIVAAGAELGTRRVLAVTVTSGGGDAMTVGLVLVDVGAKVQIGKRDLATSDRKLARELPVQLKKFLDEAPVERAKALFTDGNQHYNLGEYEQALELYKLAYKIKPLPAFLFNIGQCQRKLGHHQEAVNMYQSYLAGVPDAQNKKLVEGLIAESQQKLAQEKAEADQRAAEAAKLEEERLAAEKKQAEEQRKAKEAEAVAAAEKRIAEQARIEREKQLEKLYNRHPARAWTIAGATVGAAGLIAGGVFGMAARNAQRSFDDAGCGDPTALLGAAALAQCKSDRDRGQRDALLSNVFLGSGAAVLLASVIVFAIDPGNIERPEMSGARRAELHVSPTSFQVVVRW